MTDYPRTRRLALVQWPIYETPTIEGIRAALPDLPQDAHVVWTQPNVMAGVTDVLLASDEFKRLPLGVFPILIHAMGFKPAPLDAVLDRSEAINTP